MGGRVRQARELLVVHDFEHSAFFHLAGYSVPVLLYLHLYLYNMVLHIIIFFFHPQRD